MQHDLIKVWTELVFSQGPSSTTVLSRGQAGTCSQETLVRAWGDRTAKLHSGGILGSAGLIRIPRGALGHEIHL